MISISPYHFFLGIVILLTGCTGMKNITSSDPLFVGHEVKLSGGAGDKGNLVQIVNDLVQPEPNHRTLWMRPAVARMNMLSDSARTRKFWKNKIDNPVLLSQVAPDQVVAAIKDRMFHNGYFNNDVRFDTVRIGHRKAKYKYSIIVYEPYRFESVVFPKPDSELARAIGALKPESLIKQDDIYTLEIVKRERARIDKELKEIGYIFFSPDFVLLRADSVSGNHKLNTVITINQLTPPESRIPYTIRDVYIHDDNVLEHIDVDTLQQDHYHLISEAKELKFETFLHGLFLRPGELYSRSNYLHTLRYFNDLPIIRNANIKFVPDEQTGDLDLLLYLSHRKRFAYTAELNTIFRSTNYFGPGMIFSYTDRNANHGSELLKVNLRGSFEMQIVDRNVNFAYELGVGIDYTLPRFFPQVFVQSVEKSLPKTTLSAGYNLFNRIDLYRLNSVMMNLGYKWSRSDRINHVFTPLEIVFTSIPEDSKSQKFIDYLNDNPGVRRSFDEQFVLGAGYEFTYQSSTRRRNSFFFRGGIDASGNMLDLFYSGSNANRDSLGRYVLFGVPFSQYIRSRFEFRNDFGLSRQSNLVARFSAGVGVPIGNSTILPYIKQFYVGGTNSLRSFVARSIGPGSEVPPGGYNDVTGDIRMEANVEYRFGISGPLKGALFVDAGNIWLFNADPTRPEGQFQFNTFANQIAVSTGWGLRWDFEFVVVRLDFGYTLRTPYLPNGERWTKRINFWRPAINFAIGYPF